MKFNPRLGLGSARHAAAGWGLMLAAALVSPADAVPLSSVQLGALGDSYTFPYAQRGTRNNHLNWAEQVDRFYEGQMIFGPPRGDAPAYNRAISGDVTLQMATEQIADFGDDIVEPEVFVLFAGVNDFSGAFSILNGGSSIPLDQLPAVADTALANIQQTVANVLSEREARSPGLAAPDFVIVNTIDRGRWPRLDPDVGLDQGQAVYSAVTAATEQLNADLTDWALSQQYPVVDAYGLLNLGNTLHEDGDTLTLAGQPVAAGDNGTGQPGNSWYADFAHAGTIYHGLLANAVFQAIEARHGFTSPGLDFHDDILAAAYEQNPWPGQGSGVSLSDYLDSLDENQFEINGQPFDFDTADFFTAFLEGDLDDDGLVTEADIPAFVLALEDPAAYTTAFGLAPTAAGDFNGDGRFNLSDVEGFAARLDALNIPAGPTLAALVPEPTTAGIVLLAMVPLLNRHRRKLTTAPDVDYCA
ncbi:MAG: SGNH/GDSL hydrolase family protein [Planctomycetota bacterium]